MIKRGYRSRKANVLLNLIDNQPDVIDKIYLYAKDPHEAKYQYLINEHEKVGFDHFNDPKALIEYSKILETQSKKKVLIVLKNLTFHLFLLKKHFYHENSK